MPIHLSKWSEQDWTNERIDRFFWRQNYRLAAGVHLGPNFQSLYGSLAVVQGRGRYLRVKHVEFIEHSLPGTLQRACDEVLTVPQPGNAAFISLGADLLEHQVAIVDRLLRTAGKYVDRVLVVTVDNRGGWQTDFDGQRNFVPLYHSPSLAEKTGANVIDAISDRDIAAGGSGQLLEALPVWLAVTDRGSLRPESTQLLINFDRTIRVLLLPPSDGLDDCIPEIRGMELNWPWHSNEKHAQGELDPHEQMTSLVDQITAWVAEMSGGASGVNVERCLLFGGPEAMLESFRRAWVHPRINMGNNPLPIPEAGLGSLVAALWGMLFVDQMPGNVPGLTGARSQRILGRLTPGKPTAWRSLLINMNDGEPPNMRLRDAV